MFKSDNMGSMNVTTTFFQAAGHYLTLVTRDGQPWDYVAGHSVEAAEKNHGSMLAACAFLDLVMAERPVDGIELN